MSWNYRVMSTDCGETYEIHEVYYDENGLPHSYTENSVKPTGVDLHELRLDLQLMLASLDKPILTPNDFPDSSE